LVAPRRVVGGFDATANANVAFVCTAGGHGWRATPTAALHDPTADPTDCFGEAVAVSGATAAVGDWCASSGRVYLYTKQTGGWSTLPGTTLRPLPGPTRTLSEFGLALSMSGDTLFVGAPATDLESGEAYLFRHGNTGSWPTVPNASLPEPAATKDDRMGGSLALSAGTAIVGAPGTPGGKPLVSGTAYLYSA
jgi:hypothetical protein